MAGTFSENWYKVANLKVCLRPTVNFRRQTFRGQTWYVLHDPYNGTFFRLTPAYYDFVARLDFSRTVEELWAQTLERSPESGPGQKDVINLLVKLHHSNLLFFEDSADSSALFERSVKKQKQGFRQRWFNFLFIRFPLWNPDQWLSLFLPLWKKIFSRWGALVWVITVFLGLKTGIENAREISDQAAHILAPDNLLLLYIGVAIIKIFHEIGHGAICKRFGGEVPTIGVMFLLFLPLPYIDATSSWSFTQKWRRILVSSGGMLVEFFFGAVACLVWAYSAPGVIHALAYNMIFAATVSTLLFNANPLMRFDGYYIFADLIEVPNLFRKSREQVYGLVKRYGFGLSNWELPAQTLTEGSLLCLYGMSSMLYRIVLFTGIGLFLADRYFNIGIVLAVVMLLTWLVVPPIKFIQYLLRSPELRMVRARAVIVVSLVLAVPVVVLVLVPFPRGVVVPGIVFSEKYSEVIARTGGVVESVEAVPDTWVEAGTVLVRLSDVELELDIQSLEIQLAQMAVAEQKARRERSIDRLPIEKRIHALEKIHGQLLERREALTVTAVESGIWAFPESERVRGQWVARGHAFGAIIGNESFSFDGVVDQENASDLFESDWTPGTVRLSGHPDADVAVGGAELIPHGRDVLPSPALGWKGGGPMPLADDDTEGIRSSEPVYLVKTELEAPDAAGDAKNELHHGQTGTLYIEMTPQTMASRALTYLRQFFQKRYRL